jgi:protocatechuate 3,4-dioxygenase beta subunit
LTLVLEDASRLAGTLVDEDGEPVAGARVGLRWLGPPAGTVGLEPRRGSGSRAVETGPRGEFSFEELAPGGVELSALADGFLPGQPRTLELPPAGEVSGLRLVLRRGAVVEGRVFDPRGEPVTGARVRTGTVHAISGDDGHYRLAGLTTGVMGLHADHPDYREQIQEMHVEPGVNAVDVLLEDGWSLSGRAVDEAGGPVAGARVELRSESPRARWPRAAVSGEDGRFGVVVSEEGTYRLTATREGFAPGELTGLEVGPAPLEGVEVTLARGTSVVGRILGLETSELAGVTVEAQQEGGREPGAVTTGAVDGRGGYAVHHLSPGDWRIRARLAGGRRQAEATVAIGPGAQQVERDLELGTGLRFTGRLLYLGEPVAAAHVSLAGLDVSGERSVLSAHDGAFRIEDLAPGRYRLDVLDPARALSHLEDLELASDREIVLELEAAPLLGSVSSAETGEPLADALVYVYKLLEGGERGSLTTVATDAAGSFIVAHLTPGRYLVSARKDGYAPGEQPVEVVAGTPPGAVILRLAAAGGLTLAVSLDSGDVPRVATVSAFDSAGRKLLTDTRTPTDRGFVYFEQFPAGTWNLLVSAPGAAPRWVTAEVPGSVPGVVLAHAAPLTVRVPALMEAGAAGTLTLTLPSGDPYFQVEPGGDTRSQWSVSAGLITLPDVPAGVWSLRVDAARGGTWLETVVTDGRTPSQVSLE